MEERDERGRFVPGHSGQKAIGAGSEIRKKIISFIEARWDELPAWFDALKPKDKLLFIVELLPFAMPKLKLIDATVTQDLPVVKRMFPFGGYRNGKGEWVEVDEGAWYEDYQRPGGATREEVAAMFPPELTKM